MRTVAILGLIAGAAALVIALGNRDAASKSDVDQLSRQVTELQQQAQTTSQAAQTKVDQAIAKLRAAQSNNGASSDKKQQAQIDAIRAYLKPYGGP